VPPDSGHPEDRRWAGCSTAVAAQPTSVLSVPSLYDHLAVAVNGDPDPPGTIYTAKVETVDNDQLPAQLGSFAPL